MSGSSPAVTLFNSGGIELSVTKGSAIPANTPVVMIGGSDGTNAQYIKTDTSGVVSMQGVAGGVPLPVSGSITATNPSVSSTGAAPPASATYLGGSVTTAAPSYTTGQMSALSLTTAGLLRVDGSGVTQPVSGTFWQATQPVSIAAAVDVSDRAARLLGVTYGSQAQQLKQTATNFNLATELYAGATAYDARQIRALTSTDVVTAAQATAANLNATVVQGNAGTAAQGWFTRITDGTDNVNVTPPSTAAVATDPALVVAISPNNSVAVTGTFWPTTQPVSGTVTGNQGTAAALAGAWPVKVTDGTNTLVTFDAAARRGYVQLTDGTNQPAVKAASTAAVAADPALVVAISPNNPISATAADITNTGALGALNATVQVSTAGLNTCGF